MLRIRSAAAIAALSMLALASPAGANWHQPSGAPLNSGHGTFETPGIASVDGTPYVVWNELVSNYDRRIEVSRLNAAGTGWESVGTQLNASGSLGQNATIAAIGGRPYVAWIDLSSNDTVRVSRLNSAGTGWDALPSPAAGGSSALTPVLADVGGVPYIAWDESNGSKDVVRVSRLNSGGTGWDAVGQPIQHDPAQNAIEPSLAVIGGRPYVAWTEFDGTNAELRVSRLNDAGTAWVETGDGSASPINHDPSRNASSPNLADIDGYAYVTWTEFDGNIWQVRVARLNGDRTSWQEVVGGPSPINRSSESWWYNGDCGPVGSRSPKLVGLGNVPYVAWAEQDGTTRQIRVSRLSYSEDWKEVVGGGSPINTYDTGQACNVSAVSIGGVPYVAWDEHDPSRVGSDEVFVARLEPEFLQETSIATQDRALLLARVRTYGVASPVDFRYGLGASLGQSTGVTRSGYDSYEDTLIQSAGGLAPGSHYSWMPIGWDGHRATGLGSLESFDTESRPATAPSLLVAIVESRMHAVAGRKVTVKYAANRSAHVRLLVRRGRTTVRAAARRAHAGMNRIGLSTRHAKPGRYVLLLRATRADGQTASDRIPLRLTRRR